MARARARREPRGRRRLRRQRRRLRAPARPLRPAARGGAAGLRRGVRPPADDGPDRPGGSRPDLSADGAAGAARLSAETRRRFAGIVSALRRDRLPAGPHGRRPASSRRAGRRFAAGGHVGRAAGRAFDAGRRSRYPPYDQLRFEVPVLEAGDVDARVWIRIREVEQSLALIEQILDGLPEGPIRLAPVAPRGGEGLAFAEAFRGDVMVWVRLDEGGRVARCHPRDPSWFQWPLLEAAIEGNIVADFPCATRASTAPTRATTSDAQAPARGLLPAARDRRAPRRTRPRSRELARQLDVAARRRLGRSLASARSTPARATAASSRCRCSTTPPTTSSGSGCASSPARATPTCCWSPAR